MTYSFPARIYADSGAYSVSFPDVPGCYTYGDTFEDALQYAAEVLTGHLEVLRDIGQALPQPSTEIDCLKQGDIYAVITCEVDVPLVQSAG